MRFKNIKIFNNEEIAPKPEIYLINQFPKISIKPKFFKKVWPAKQYKPKSL